MSSSSSSTVLLINDIRSKLVILICILYIIFGTIGNILNIILFRKRILWTLSPCIPYLFIASFVNLFIIYGFVPFRLLSGFQINPANVISILCKFQLFTYYVTTGLSTWFMVACCSDRFFSSSPNALMRRYSNLRMTIRISSMITFLIFIVYLQILYCYDTNQFAAISTCNVQTGICSVIDVIWMLFFQTIGPPILMLIFGIGTFIHIKQKQRIQPLTANTTETQRDNNKHILPMLFIQVIMYLLCIIPLLATKIYQNMTLSFIKSDVHRAVDSLVFILSILSSLVDKIFSFYIYTLFSKFY
ncbi:unnamed protein product [Adineta ricciae]|uniref:G-protein coupled receptors family 1 profile domain-containing protein n=1 Tax=Adineta ricciae TaxID=249248 RepID=A0A815LR11_ADIRI|nr:unnamed protein product [Adineta ricciae]CAF1410946.1 unnamed protein product [Adineta ricciae]